MTNNSTNWRTRFLDLARQAIEYWALAGALLLVAVVLMTTWSVFTGTVFGQPFAGDFELTEIGVAVAAFAFLPYCQLIGANVTADIFTSGLSRRSVSFLILLATIVAFIFGAILLWRMYAGMLDYQKYLETTTILQVPLWYGFVPILMSLALLVVAAFIVLVDTVSDIRDYNLNGNGR